MANPHNVELEAAKFLQKLIKESKDESTKLATKLYVILQHMRASGKENSLPYQVISMAMETVIKQNGLDIDALTSSLLPNVAGTQVGESGPSQGVGSSQRAGVGKDPKASLTTNELIKPEAYSSGRTLVGPSSSGHDIYQGSPSPISAVHKDGTESISAAQNTTELNGGKGTAGKSSDHEGGANVLPNVNKFVQPFRECSMAMGDRTPAPSSNEPTTSLKIQSPQPSSVNIRLWRSAAQRNLRNQWSKLASLRHDWVSASSSARAHATSLVNSFLSQKYMDTMELGILSEMPDIRKKACLKLSKQQDLRHNKLLLSYKDMVGVVVNMINTSRFMRCYTKGATNNPVAQFSCFPENQNDRGDGGGIPVFTFWPVSHFEKLAGDFIQMFVLEINLKRLLVMEFLLLGNHQSSKSNRFSWLDEFYPGELEDLNTCNSYSNEACLPGLPSHPKYKVETSLVQPMQQHDRDVLQVYLTTWIAEVNMDQSRLDEVITEIGAEMHVTLP